MYRNLLKEQLCNFNTENGVSATQEATEDANGNATFQNEVRKKLKIVYIRYIRLKLNSQQKLISTHGNKNIGSY